MASASRATLRPFTPSREAPEALVERTVGREHLLATILGRMRAAAMSGNRSHTLVVGPRGSGKTHVLDVAIHRVRNDAELSSRLAIGRVDEDVVGVVTYVDLLLQLLASLKPPIDVLDQARASRDVAAVEAAIIEHLGDRVLVAVVENLSKVFDTLGTSGQRNFRSFVETTGQVVLLASTPLLFQALGSRNEPWFGSFAIEHIPELTLDEGIEVIRRLAVQDDDDRFVAFLDSPKGRARLAALHHLAGGSPRLWMILAGCATVELLDDLVPAVETLLENLVAYYQQRLWELPGNEQKLVRELGTGPPSATVGELAAIAGLEERTAASALGRLVDTGWVRREKLPGADQRKSWYRLREPLLRHHFQYRQADGEPLRLIVDILRTWFDPIERRFHLAAVRPTSVAERHLLATLSLDPAQRSDGSYADRDVDRLLAEARSWMDDPDAIGTRDAGILVEAAMNALRTTPEDVRQVLADRNASPSVLGRAEELLGALSALPSDKSVEDRTATLLDVAATVSLGGADHRILELLAACWNGATDPVKAVRRLEVYAEVDSVDRLNLTIRDEHGFWLGQAGCHEEAVAILAAVLEKRNRTFGPDDLDTLNTRAQLAFHLNQIGRHEEAITIFTEVLGKRILVLGAEHPNTLTTGAYLAYALARCGRYDEAIDVGVRTFDQEVIGKGKRGATSDAAIALIFVLVSILKAGEPLPPLDGLGFFVASGAHALLRDMEAARNGSAQAAARLPAELRALVELPISATEEDGPNSCRA